MRLTFQEYCDFLQSTQLGQFLPIPESSNDALLCSTEDPDIWCVYKPQKSERDLYDFPQKTLAQREVASYYIANALGLHYIPPTVLAEGPLGLGSIQLWVGNNPLQQLGNETVFPTDSLAAPNNSLDSGFIVQNAHRKQDVILIADAQQHSQQSVDLVMLAEECPVDYLPVIYVGLESEQELVLAHVDTPILENIAFLDLLLNNADRKGSHILAYADKTDNTHGIPTTIWALDHGLCLHSQWKLRTVLWGFASRKLSSDLQKILHKVPELIANLDELANLLSATEIKALLARAKILASEPVFPTLYYSAQLPWPWF